MADRDAQRDEPMPPFLGAEEAEPDFERAGVAILPVPFEGTVSWVHGTASGPAAILRASPHLEFTDEQSGVRIADRGIWTDRMLDAQGSAEQVAASVTRRFGELLDAGKWVVMLGGEHSITPGGVRAAAERHPGLHVVQLDAHADLRDSYGGGNRWNHACAMARTLEHATITAVGIRSYSGGEARRIEEGIPGYRIVHGWEMEGEDWIERSLAGIDGRPVYLTVDLDYFDPSIIPATGTPVPGGGEWWPTLRMLESLFARAVVVGCDVVELAPFPGLHHADFTAASLVYKLIGYVTRP